LFYIKYFPFKKHSTSNTNATKIDIINVLETKSKHLIVDESN